MIVCADGKGYGTIGGSLLEGTAIEAAKTALIQKKSRFLNFNLTSDDVTGPYMICGGKTVLLLDYVPATKENIEFFQKWQEVAATNTDFYFLTKIKESGEVVDIIGRGLLFHNGETIGDCKLTRTDIEDLKTRLRIITATSVFSLDGTEVIADPMGRIKTLYCFGAGHVAVPTAHIASMVGFRVVVTDDRDEFANKERFPNAAEIRINEEYQNAVADIAIDEDSFIVILTRGHQYDRVVLEQALKTSAGYIGMIASRKKRDMIYSALIETGVSWEHLHRVHSPIGLDIDAETPEEIAVSIVSELIKERARQRV
jgi:xanthine dehydrogenase accessory factor